MFAQTKHVALVALLAASPLTLAAQTAPEPADPAATTGETGPAEPLADAVAPSDPNMTPAPADQPAIEAEAPPAPVEGQIVMQSENTILADDLIGATVHSATDETIGDINDLIVNLDGTVEGVVIGVGGFLGIGEKRVAVEMSVISVAADPDNGDVRLLLSSTREDLEAAPAFVSVRDQNIEKEMQEQSQTGVTPLVPAPATPAN